MSEKPKKEIVKANATEMEIRVEKVLNHILMGRGRPWIVRFAAKEWGLASRMVDELMARARDEMKAINAGNREETIEQIISNYWLLYRQAMHKQDHYLALSVLKEVARVKGLNQDMVVHTIDDKRETKDVEDADLEKALEAQASRIQ